MTSNLGSGAHARILYAYLSRLSVADINQIASDAMDWHHASLNLGMGSQIKAQEEMMLSVNSAVGRMIDHDKGLVEETIRRVLATPECGA